MSSVCNISIPFFIVMIYSCIDFPIISVREHTGLSSFCFQKKLFVRSPAFSASPTRPALGTFSFSMCNYITTFWYFSLSNFSRLNRIISCFGPRHTSPLFFRYILRPKAEYFARKCQAVILRRHFLYFYSFRALCFSLHWAVSGDVNPIYKYHSGSVNTGDYELKRSTLHTSFSLPIDPRKYHIFYLNVQISTFFLQ